ncbi:MAG: M23 family metallopeptidase [Clostridia bacterium]|nr:M23 family metallopeptidase [Clostridia bacterium]
MKLFNIKFFKVGSVKSRCKTHKEKIIFTLTLISSLVLLMTSIMCTPAEAVYTTDGFGIFVDEEFILPTISSEDAQAILEGVKAWYSRDGAEVVRIGYKEDVRIEECEIKAQDVKSVDDGIAFIVGRKKPLITVLAEQSYSVYEEVQEEKTYSTGDFSYDLFDKIRAEDFNGVREYSVLLTTENDVILKREIKDQKLVVTAQAPMGYKGLQFTESEAMRLEIGFVEPVEMNVTCPYGVSRMETGYHLGVDFYNPSGTPIVSAASGIVSYIGEEGSYGKLIIINHGCNVQTYYAHCRSIDVQVGDAVEAGDYIGTVGSTGRTTGSHLHFELRLNGGTLDPMDYL